MLRKMFSLSLRRPLPDFIDSTADCFIPWSSPPMMNIEIPVIMKQMESFSRDFIGDNGISDETSTKKPKKFDLKLAMRSFRPEDIKVKVEGSNVIVEAKREEKKEEDGSYSYAFREVKRTYPIPEGVDKTKLSSAFTKNGVLEIEAPSLEAIEEVPTKTAIEVTHASEE